MSVGVEECNTLKCTQIAPKEYRTSQFKLSDIPSTMDRLNWPTLAKLMRYWFAGEPYIKNSTKGPGRTLEDVDIEALSASAKRLGDKLTELEQSLVCRV